MTKKEIIGVNKYDYIHRWVEKQLGKPMECWKCHTKEKRTYHWSNISGNYHKDLSDWERLCVPCHFKKDFFKTHCPTGHEFTKENTRINKMGHRVCKKCQNIAHQKWREGLKSTPERLAYLEYRKSYYKDWTTRRRNENSNK